MRSHPLFVVGLGGLIFGTSLVVGVVSESCKGSDASPDGGNPYGDPCQDGTVQLVSCLVGPDGGPATEHFSDEACLNLEQAEMRAPATPSNTIAPTITAPAAGAMVSGTTPFVFTWTAGNVALCHPPPTFRALTFADEWSRWATLIPTADAHCPPFSGLGYAAVFSAQGAEVLRAETQFLSYTPTANAWTTLKGASGPISMRVEVAQFNTTQLTGGPWTQTSPVTFTITP